MKRKRRGPKSNAQVKIDDGNDATCLMDPDILGFRKELVCKLIYWLPVTGERILSFQQKRHSCRPP